MNLMQMSLSGAAMALVVVIARALLLNRLPKRTFVLLWALVALRLLVPIALPFDFGAAALVGHLGAPSVESAQPIAPSVHSAPAGATNLQGVPGPQGTANPRAASNPHGTADLRGASDLHDMPSLQDAAGPQGAPDPQGALTPTAPAPTSEAPGAFVRLALDLGFGPLAQAIGSDPRLPLAIWAVGALGCGGFFAFTSLRCHRMFRCALPLANNDVDARLARRPLRRHVRVLQSDRIGTPLTYGIARPVIVVPRSIAGADPHQLAYVLEHELTHIRRFDGLVKLVLLAAACLHWFNPLAWVACTLAARDIELACDERVVRTFGTASRADYARTLVRMGELACRPTPLASGFGTTAIEERIGAIMKTRRTTLATALAASALVIAIPTALATSAPDAAPADRRPAATAAELADVLAGYTVPAGAEAYTVAEWEMVMRAVDAFKGAHTPEATGAQLSVATLHTLLAEKCGFGDGAGRDLLERFAGDETLYAQRFTNRLAGYIYYALMPLASDSWNDYTLHETIATCTDDGVEASFSYTMHLPVANPEELQAVTFYSLIGENAKRLSTIFDYLGDEALTHPTVAVSLLEAAIPAVANSRWPGEAVEVRFSYAFTSEHEPTARPAYGQPVILEGLGMPSDEALGHFVSADAQAELDANRFRTILEPQDAAGDTA